MTISAAFSLSSVMLAAFCTQNQSNPNSKSYTTNAVFIASSDYFFQLLLIGLSYYYLFIFCSGSIGFYDVFIKLNISHFQLYKQQEQQSTIIMAQNFKGLKGFWETRQTISSSNQPQNSEAAHINKNKNTETGKSDESPKYQINQQLPRQSVAQMRKNLQGKLKFLPPPASKNNTPPIINHSQQTNKKPNINKIVENQLKVQPTHKNEQGHNNNSNNQIPSFRKSQQILENAFMKKQQKTPQNQANNRINSKEKKITKNQYSEPIVPKTEDKQQPKKQQKYINVGKHQVFSSAMKNSSLTPEERTDQIMLKIFGANKNKQITNKPQYKQQSKNIDINNNLNPMPEQLVVRNKNKGKRDLGDFDDI